MQIKIHSFPKMTIFKGKEHIGFTFINDSLNFQVLRGTKFVF